MIEKQLNIPSPCHQVETDWLKHAGVKLWLKRDDLIHPIISGNKWRIGSPIGAGSFGGIYLASNDITKPVDFHNANYVTKIEPHSNGPLFVEIHCLLNVNKGNKGTLTKLNYCLIPAISC